MSTPVLPQLSLPSPAKANSECSPRAYSHTSHEALRPSFRQHPATVAEAEMYQAKMEMHAAQRRTQLASQLRRTNERRAREIALNLPYARARVEANFLQQKRAEVEAYKTPQFWDVNSPRPTMNGGSGQSSPRTKNAPRTAQPPSPVSLQHPPSPRKLASSSSSSSPRKREIEQLTSSKTVRAVLDIFYDKMAAEDDARRSRQAVATLDQVTRSFIEATNLDAKTSLAGTAIPGGLLGLRIGCAECDPHPSIRLFQRLMGWTAHKSEAEMQPAQRESLWLTMQWLLPPKPRMLREVERMLTRFHGDGEQKPKLGGAIRYEPMPPRTTIDTEAIPKVLKMLGARRLVVNKEQLKSLVYAAKSLHERRGRAAKQCDVEELLLYWTEIWDDWNDQLNSLPLDGKLPPRKQVRVDREDLAKKKISLGSSRQMAAQEFAHQRHEAMAALDADAPVDHITGERIGPGDEPLQMHAEEGFEAGMRANAMEFDVIDADRDKKLDYDEFVQFIKQRERGPHSGFELRARFDALDADRSGQIDLHEFIRFSLRDSLARSAARVMDLFREWDEDGNGVIDRGENLLAQTRADPRREFRRAIHALGFGALADTEDIDMVFDEFDESKDGELEFKEINKMLRQSAAVDARMVGGAKGRVALKAEREAKLKRTKNERKGVNRLVALNPAKIVRGRELLAELKSLFSAMPADKLMDLFREIDQSGDGIIDQAEFNLAIRALGFSLPKDELKLLFRQLDPDSSGTIEYHELRQALCGK